ncbi:MAG: hypothetical protein U1C49_02180 [Candidatus Andersenbacteria bacterium]|nr:hypothetical protein [bacterium]MDZ4225635.1 hypothetical protein [Candidatus Andersenbacteria bacterium]
MDDKSLRRWLAGIFLLTVVLGLAAYRNFVVPAVLRNELADARWQVAPYLLFLLLVAVLWWSGRDASGKDEDK